jgi:serine/threonine protein kinase
MEQHHFIVERLGTELVEELRHLLDDAFILDALTKITSSKSFKWHSNYARTKVEVLKWMADFVGEEENQGYLRHLKVKYPEVIKLTFVRTTSAKKLSKKEKSQKKLTLVERKIKAFDWELLPDQLAFGEIIGTGSFGAVYHATLYPGGEEVAVKMLTEDVGFEDSATFMKEIAILSRLFHPAIVGFIGASITGSLYLVMEYCSEGNLKTYLQSHSAVTTWRMKMKLARQTAEGIEYLHQQSPPIVHRDLKCQNILVTCDGDAKVSDFGLSKTLSRTVGNASKMGTLNWLAPEVLRGEAHHSTAADVYAFGMVLYEILMDGTPPYDSWQPLQIVRAIDEGLQPEIPPTCDPLYKELMEDCWSLNPASRPKFSEICSRLRAIERLTFAHKSQCSSGDSTPTASPRSGSASLLMSSSPKKRILAAPSASSDHPVRAGSSSSCLASTEEPRASSLKLGRKQHKGSPEHF